MILLKYPFIIRCRLCRWFLKCSLLREVFLHFAHLIKWIEVMIQRWSKTPNQDHWIVTFQVCTSLALSNFVKGENPDLSYHTKSNKGCIVSLKLILLTFVFNPEKYHIFINLFHIHFLQWFFSNIPLSLDVDFVGGFSSVLFLGKFSCILHIWLNELKLWFSDGAKLQTRTIEK